METLERVSDDKGSVDIPQELLIYSNQLELKEIIGQGKETCFYGHAHNMKIITMSLGSIGYCLCPIPNPSP